MSLWESFITAWRALLVNKLRSALTILGIIIGVSAVVFLVSFGRGHQANVTAVFESMGADLLYVTGAKSVTTQALQEMTGATASLTLEDAKALKDPVKAPSISLVTPIIQSMGNLSFEKENTTTTIIGTTSEALHILRYSMAKGVFISEEDEKRKASVAVLGDKTAKDLFGSRNPLGEKIKINGRNFEVIGVLEKKGAFMAAMDDFVIIPLSTMQAKILGVTTPRGQPVQAIAVKPISINHLNTASEEITSILRQRHRIKEGEDDDFAIFNMQEILNRMREVLAIFQVFLGSVGGISLLVGGIGIMNIMLVSVAERTREIGIRKAVGAKNRDILRQFLVEAATLSLTGGAIGVLIAAIGTRLITGVRIGPYPVKAPMSPDIVLIALAVAVFVGLASGFYPAFRASRLDPIQALRYE